MFSLSQSKRKSFFFSLFLYFVCMCDWKRGPRHRHITQMTHGPIIINRNREHFRNFDPATSKKKTRLFSVSLRKLPRWQKKRDERMIRKRQFQSSILIIFEFEELHLQSEFCHFVDDFLHSIELKWHWEQPSTTHYPWFFFLLFSLFSFVDVVFGSTKTRRNKISKQ